MSRCRGAAPWAARPPARARRRGPGPGAHRRVQAEPPPSRRQRLVPLGAQALPRPLLAHRVRRVEVARAEQPQPHRLPDPPGRALQHRRLSARPRLGHQRQQLHRQHRAQQVVEGVVDGQRLLGQPPGPLGSPPPGGVGQHVQGVRQRPALAVVLADLPDLLAQPHRLRHAALESHRHRQLDLRHQHIAVQLADLAVAQQGVASSFSARGMSSETSARQPAGAAHTRRPPRCRPPAPPSRHSWRAPSAPPSRPGSARHSRSTHIAFSRASRGRSAFPAPGPASAGPPRAGRSPPSRTTGCPPDTGRRCVVRGALPGSIPAPAAGWAGPPRPGPRPPPAAG